MSQALRAAGAFYRGLLSHGLQVWSDYLSHQSLAFASFAPGNLIWTGPTHWERMCHSEDKKTGRKDKNPHSLKHNWIPQEPLSSSDLG